MPYTWNGLEFDDPTWQGGRQAGIAGALAGMSQVSGDKWNGIADWLSRAAAGFQGGQQDYLTNAFRVQQALEQQRLQEEYRQSQIAENEAQARRYQAQAEAQAQQAEARARALQSLGIDPGTPDSLVDNLLAQRQREEERSGMIEWGRDNNLNLDGIPPAAISAFISSQMPNPERDARLANIESQIADREADNQRAVALELAKAEIAESEAALSGIMAEDRADQRAGTFEEPSTPLAAQAHALARRPTARTAILEKHGLVPRNVEGGAPVSTSKPKPLPESKVQNPNVPTDEQMAKMLKVAQLPPRFSDDPDFVESLRQEIAANVAAGMDKKMAAITALRKAKEIAARMPMF